MLFCVLSVQVPCHCNAITCFTRCNALMSLQVDYTICAVLSIKTQNYKRHFIRFHQLPHLINTTIYQYIIIQSVVIYDSKSVLLTV